MSENIPQSVPTSSAHRPHKKPRLTPSSSQSAHVEALFANPDREITIPTGAKAVTTQAPPEIVANVQGSSAGAGSGEFHVYKASRRREYERLRIMDEEVEKEEKDREWEEKRAKAKAEEDEKAKRNREKREKAKARAKKAKQGKNGGGVTDGDNMDETGDIGNAVKLKQRPAKAVVARDDKMELGDADANEGGQAEAAEEAGLTIHDDD